MVVTARQHGPQLPPSGRGRLRLALALLTLQLSSLHFAWAAPDKTPGSDEAAQLAEIAARLRRSPPSPQMLADCLAAAASLDAVTPDRIVALLKPVAARWLRRGEASEPSATTLRALLREAAWRADVRDVAAPWAVHPGEVRAWSVLGPFDAGHGSAFDRVDPVETERGAAVTYAGRDGPVRWLTVPEVLAQRSTGLRLEGLYERSSNVIVYGRSFIRLRKPTQLRLRLAAVGPARLLVDGVRVLQTPLRSGGSRQRPALLLPQQTVALALGAGWHEVRVKLAAEQGRTWLGLEVLDPAGRPLAVEQRPDLPGGSDQATVAPPATPASTSGIVTWQKDLLARARPSRAAKGKGLAALASLAMAAGAGWPLQPEVRAALDALLAAHTSPTIGLLMAQMAAEAGDRIARLRPLVAADPANQSFRLALVLALDEMGKSAAAHALWQAEPSGDGLAKSSVRACKARTDLWLRLGVDGAALAAAGRCRRRWPRSPVAVAVSARMARARDHLTLAAGLQAELAALEPGKLSHRVQHAGALIQAGDLAAAVKVAEELERRAPAATSVAEMVANGLAADRNWPGARAWLDRLPSWRWRSTTHELSARVATASGQRDRAIADLRSALQRAPSRAELRARLRLLEPPRGFYQAYQRDLLALARGYKGKGKSAPLTRLLRQTVIQVLGGGRQARYEVDVLAVGKGGPTTHEIEIPFVPSQSAVEVLRAEVMRRDGRVDRRVGQELEQLGEGADGLYYDLEQIKLTFKDLEAGDVILVEAVTRDFAGDPFGFVFGELLPLAGHRPILETELIVQLPAGTPLHHVVWDPVRREPHPAAMIKLPAPVSSETRGLPEAPSGRKASFSSLTPKLRRRGRRAPGWRRPRVSRLFRPDLSAEPMGNSSEGRSWDIWRLHLRDTAAVAAEEDMPGVTSTVPYLHMSSFASWTAAASWYAGLLRQSLRPPGTDAQLAALARRLTAEQSDERGRVAAIYRHVADKIRYVGLEFGIHSLQPHAPGLVLQRQFGDCKDKATLIVALLAELGIRAEVALVRTAGNGRLGDGVASLGVFDHAIAYVPSLGWWLDGTVQGHAGGEVPEGDAGGVALRVPLAVTRSQSEDLPVAPAAANLRQESIEIALSANGDAELTVELRFRGLPAAQVRSSLFAPTTRRERLEEDMTRRFPGMTLTSFKVVGVEPILTEVRISIRGHVPHWAVATEGGLRLQPLRRDTPLVQQLAGAAKREHPLVQRWAGLSVQRLHLRPPAGMVVQRAPPSSRLDDPLIHFELRAEPRPDGSLILHKRFERRLRQVPAAQWDRWRTSLGRIDSALSGVIHVGAPAAAAP